DIEKVAVCSSLRSLKSTRTIESKAKRSSKIISLGHDSTLLASSHTVKMGFNSLVYSLRALSALRRSGLRMASTAAKPCQGDSLEFYLITGINTALGVFTVGTQVNTANIDNLSDVVICAFLASQLSSPQLVNDDLEQIHPDDLEEMDLRWQMAMLTMTARRFEYKVPRSEDTKHKETTRRTVPVETPASTALVSCDGLGGYDWSDQAKEDLKKSKLMVLGYKTGLQLVEERLEFFKKNEFIYLEDIKVLEVEIQMKDIAIKELRRNYKVAQKEKEGIQLTVEKLKNASKSLNKLIDCQIVDNCKKRLDEFFVKPIVENKSSKEETKAFRKNPDAPMVEVGGTCSILEIMKKLKEDIFLIKVTPKEGKSLAKLIDEIQVLLRVPRKNNVYSNDLKNIVFNGGLTCLFAKATSDESKLWHRRLGHLNFKTMSKLVKEILVAEGRNKTLIEAARTMLADSKLLTTFWAEAVNTTCYVQNRVLVVKSHNKTLYELFHGRTLALSFMKPFGCLVTILNTLDHLGKFNGKADEGFFIGYSLSCKAFRVFNSRKRIVEENLHIRFNENTLNVVDSGPDWLFDIDALTRIINYEPITAGTQSNGFAGTKVCDNAGQARKEKEPVKDYILLPLWTANSPFFQDPKSSQDDGFQPLSDSGKMADEDPSKGSKCRDQDKDDNANSTNNVNAASTNRVNAVSENISNELPSDINMPALKDTSTFNFSSDHEKDDEEADMNNIDTKIQVSPVPTTRIHKDHPLDQVIRDLHSTTQTRNMSKNLEEHGF
nr:ribonuclease H-like domain-containing protein [Tanacetum cinerariifolium]